MFDIGVGELLVILIVAVIVIGPKDLPLAMRTAGRWIGKIRRVSAHFRSGIDTMVREAELEVRINRLANRLPETALAISKGEKVALDASGQQAEKVLKIDAVDIAASLSWRSGNLIFRGETLAEAVAEISRYTDIQFELADDAKLKDIHVAGMFKTGDVNGLLAVFKSNFNISHERLSRDKILLKLEG